MKKKRFLLPLLMALVMMAMSPQKVWALSGSGTSSSPYLIYDATDLKDFRTIVNGSNSAACAKLMNNITLSDTWTPIGVNGHTYSGTFLGQNHTISGMSMNVTGWEEGLFGWIQGATIEDLTVSGQMTSTTTNGSCRESIGGVVGLARGVNTITNVHSNVNITMNHNNFKGVGGVVGKAEENYGISTIKNCSYSGTLTLNSNIGFVGGIVGYVTQGANVTNCSFTGSIKTCDGCDYIGGIAGFFYRGDVAVTISNCTNAGAMTLGKGSEIGGIFGHAAGNLNILNNTFAGGATINTATSSTACGFVGGIAGKTDGTILIQQCTAAGSINVGASYDCIAGIVGYCQPNSNLTIKSCLYSGHISNTSTNSDINRVAGIIAYATDNGNNFGGIKGCLCCGSFSTPSSNTIKPAAIASALYDNALDRMTDNYYRSDMATTVVFHYSGGHSINTSSNISRTATQISSGQVAYELYNGSIDGHTSWRQNIGTDNNPVLDQTHGMVYLLQDKYCTGSNYGSSYYSNNSIASSDHHTFSSQTVSDTYKKSDATCTADAVYYYKCSGCTASSKDKTNTTWTNTGSALGHNYTPTISDTYLKSAATCNTANVYYYSCSRCGANEQDDNHTFADVSSILNHNFVSQTVSDTYKKSDASCTSPAVYYYNCSRCSTNEKNNSHTFTSGNTLDHNYTEARANGDYKKSEATCTAAAVYYYSCSRCLAYEKNDSHTFTSGNALGHSYTGITVSDTYKKSDATCTSAAVYYYNCFRCSTNEKNDSHTFTSGNTLDHNFTVETESDTYLKSATTCVTDGVYYYKCANCTASSKDNTNTTWTKTGSALGHSMTEHPAVDPTCTKTGNVLYYTCSREKGVYYKDNADYTTNKFAEQNEIVRQKADHSFGDDVTKSRCSVCNHYFFHYTADGRITPIRYDRLKGATGNTIYIDSQNTWNSSTGEGVMELNEPLVTIDEQAFKANTSLRGSLCIPNTVVTIGSSAFYDCTNLNGTLTIPNSVTSIGAYAFGYCNFNGTLNIPPSVTSIGERAFAYHNTRATVLLHGIPAFGGVWTFYKGPSVLSITLDDNSYVSNNYDCSYTFASVAYTRTQKNQWGTIVVPFNVKNSEKYCFYTLTSVSGDALTITKVDDETGLAAGTPALIFMTEQAKNAETDKYDLTLTAANTTVRTAINNPEAINGLALTGTYQTTDISEQNGYFISGGKFYNIHSQVYNSDGTRKQKNGKNISVSLGAFRAYLKGTLTNGAAQLRISISDEEVETALEVLDALTSGEGVIYDLNGRKQQNLHEGVNIIKRGNKSVKVIVK